MPYHSLQIYSDIGWLSVLTLTTFHFEQGFSQDATSHTNGLADIIAWVFNLDIGDCQLATKWHRETTWLCWLLDWEQQDL